MSAAQPPTCLTRYWFVNRRGAINIEIVDGENVAEIRVRSTGKMLTKRIEMRENGGIQTGSCSPPQTVDWHRFCDAAFLSVPGWKSERNFT